MSVSGNRFPPSRSLSTVSDFDIPNVLRDGNDGQLYSELNGTENMAPEEMSKKWEMNYHEASIFLEEGENNDKFNSHPKSRDALPSYLLVHNDWFYTLDIVASLMLLSLAAVEEPSIPLFSLPIWIHGSLEILGLLVVAAELVLKLRWQGWTTFIRHTRTMIKAGTLMIMFVEAVVVMVRQSNHVRVTRALRPIFLIDNHYCGGVRRFIRQILQSLPPILDMLGLLLFFMLIFSVLGFYLFSHEQNNPYFSTLESSFINLFVLLTTANFPDVMMPSYSKSKWSTLYFIIYLSIVLYFLMNLMLAVVYDAFTVTEKGKFRKLLLHKRKACRHAFRLLVSRTYPHRISFKHFEGLMKFYAPKKSRRDVYLIFKAMNTNSNGVVTLDEFYNVYDFAAIQWTVMRPDNIWFHNFENSVKKVLKCLYILITSKWFDYFIHLVVFINGVCMLMDTAELSNNVAQNAIPLHSRWYHLIFVAIYTVEALLKILALGPTKYYSSGWNVYDFIILLTTAISLVSEYFGVAFYYVIILRTLRLLKFFQMKRRYRDVFDTLLILLPRMVSTSIVFLLLYYFFAVIGMEIFAGYDMKNCCRNTTVESYYRYNSSNVFEGYYYLNNFDNMFNSGVTLFELTVINNWYVIMEGFAFVSSPLSRVYFMTFYIVTMVVMTIVVAFILEAFLFHIQYERSDSKDDEKDFSVKVSLTKEELVFCYNRVETAQELAAYTRELNIPDRVVYRGIRPRTKHMLSLKMYKDEVKDWLKAAADEELSMHHISLNTDEIPNDTAGQGLLPFFSRRSTAYVH